MSPAGASDPGERHKLAAARLWAAQRFPYLATALFASPVTFVEGLGTVSADRRWRLYADPDVVRRWPVEVTGATLVHHVGHLLREHAERAELAGVHDADADAWLDATDAEINDDLVGVVDLPEGTVTPERLGHERGRLAEEYFAARPGEGRNEGGGDGSAADGHDDGHDDGRPGDHQRAHDCGSAAHGRHRRWEHPDGPGAEGAPGEGGLSGAAGELVRRQVAGEILNHAKEAGTVPAGLQRWAEQLLRPKVDWRKALAAELRRGISEVSGRVDYSYRRPSRRAAAVADVVLPSLRRPVPEVAVVVDTSGSMGEDLLADVLTEVEGILRSVGVGSLRVLSVDTEAHSVRRVRSAAQVDLVGGGGTDMGAGVDAALALRPRPSVVVVLTDGFTPWPPASPKGAVVVVGLVGQGAPNPPGWARVVRIDDAP